jgi:predicted DNA-binding protein
MKTKAVKKQTAFRLNENLPDRLKTEAQKANKSLSNYVECILMDSVYREPNETTVNAMKEARDTGRLETLDMNRFDDLIASL